ncbi:MAG TPA: GxxExxY protein [bacterium]|nr:GxxExxY protein [bacterium]
MEEKEVMRLCDRVRETSMAIHKYLRWGHLEKVYENALVHRLYKAGIKLERQYPVSVYDEDGELLGQFVADLLIEGELLVELKACRNIAEEHTAQILGYLRATGLEHGMLINFGAPRLQIRKYILNRDDIREGDC